MIRRELPLHNMTHTALAAEYADRLGRRYGRLAGRGTAALYLAFRAIALRDGTGEVIVPDLICSTALDAILLAGHTPVFADVILNRWTIDPDDALRRVTNRTRAVLVAHLFGHIATFPHDPFVARSIPIVEDAIQGLGGAIGQLGDLTVIGFADSKMIGGRGGVVLTDDPNWRDLIDAIPLDTPEWTIGDSDSRVRAYAPQLRISAPALITPFDASPGNIVQIQHGWEALAGNVRRRNRSAEAWRAGLADLPLELPDLVEGDAIWRFTFAAHTLPLATRIARALQQAGVPGTRLYPSLSHWLGGSSDAPLYSPSIAPRLINLWVTPPIAPDNMLMRRAIAVIRASV